MLDVTLDVTPHAGRAIFLDQCQSIRLDETYLYPAKNCVQMGKCLKTDQSHSHEVQAQLQSHLSR